MEKENVKVEEAVEVEVKEVQKPKKDWKKIAKKVAIGAGLVVVGAVAAKLLMGKDEAKEAGLKFDHDEEDVITGVDTKDSETGEVIETVYYNKDGSKFEEI